MTNTKFFEETTRDWQLIHQRIFGTTIPDRYEWHDINQIVDVLDTIGSFADANHTFFPSGGGIDLDGAALSHEAGCIELDFGIAHIMKPKVLVFESIDDQFEWNYFRLELEPLQPTGVYDNPRQRDEYDEQLCELEPGHYVDSYFWDEGRYNDEPLPAGARVVIRCLKGAFVIFKKSSIYNENTATYDGRHETMGADGFREHIRDAFQQVGNRQ